MMKTISILVICLLSEATAISDSCLQAICEVSSNGCYRRRCRWEDNRRGCGYFHIDRAYYRNCGKPGGGWVACSNNLDCSERCVRKYLSQHGTRCTGGRYPTCQDYARIHFGGPRGCHSSGTNRYWLDVQQKLNGK